MDSSPQWASSTMSRYGWAGAGRRSAATRCAKTSWRIGTRRPEPGRQLGEHLDQRPERRRGGYAVTRADGDPRRRVGAGRDLLHERRLADAGLPRDEDQAPVAGRGLGQPSGRRAQLRIPFEERHVPMVGAGAYVPPGLVWPTGLPGVLDVGVARRGLRGWRRGSTLAVGVRALQAERVGGHGQRPVRVAVDQDVGIGCLRGSGEAARYRAGMRWSGVGTALRKSRWGETSTETIRPSCWAPPLLAEA